MLKKGKGKASATKAPGPPTTRRKTREQQDKGEATMDLEEFVTETLRQIIVGVERAQKIAKEHNAQVNPDDLHPAVATIVNEDGQVGQLVEFDVALTAVEKDQAEGRVGLLVAPLGIGVKGSQETQSSSISRVKFTVPVFLPVQY